MATMRDRRGFSLIEILVAMTLTLAVFAITLPFVRSQSRALGSNAGRMDAEQVARYAQRAVDRELRLVQADPGQPRLVMAGPMAIAFNANVLAPDSTDTEALEVEAGAPAALAESWATASATTLPLVARSYPAFNYYRPSGQASRNETVMYFLRPDTVSGRSDVYVLYRRVNARDSVQVARGIHVPDDSAFFSYYVPSGDTLSRIAASRLPLYWDSTAIGDIRAVGLRVGGFFRNRLEGQDVIRTVQWRTVLPAVTTDSPRCGSVPSDPRAVAVNRQTGSDGFHVRVTWNRSPDDGPGRGDADVTHYIVGTRVDTTGAQWQDLAAMPSSGASNYRYEHYLPSLTGNVKYGVQAVDCGGNRSAFREHNSNLSLP